MPHRALQAVSAAEQAARHSMSPGRHPSKHAENSLPQLHMQEQVIERATQMLSHVVLPPHTCRHPHEV